MNELSYPIGKFKKEPFSESLLGERLNHVKDLPLRMEYAITNLDEAQLHTAYRPEGWTVHELIHHVADSHMNAYIRFKLGLTEDNPIIKTYDQDAWAILNDTVSLPVNVSLTLLHAVHKRLYALLITATEQDWQRTIHHPEQQADISLWDLLGIYVHHGLHHEAHILNLRKRMSW